MHLWRLLELGDFLEVFDQTLDQLEALIDVGILAAAENDREDHLVFGLQEFLGAIDLGHQVVLADFGAQTELFVLAVMRVPFVLPFFLLVLELAKVHDAANGRLLLRCDLDQVEAGVARALQGYVCFDDAKLVSFCADHADRRDADLLVDALRFAVDRVVSYGVRVGRNDE
jgi:hypothetical protein